MKEKCLIVFLLLSLVIRVKGSELAEEKSKVKQLHELDFKFTNQYRNNILEPTWSIYSQNYQNDPITASLPRFENLYSDDDQHLHVSRNKNGLHFQTEKNSSSQIFKIFSRIQTPCVLAKLQVSDYSRNHTSKIGFAKDTGNYVMLSKVKNSSSGEFVFELKQQNEKTITKTFSGIKTNGNPYTLYFFLGNDDFRFLIETSDGVQHVGMVSISRTCFTKINELKGYSPAFGVELGKKEYATIKAFSAGYFEGIGHADIRSVTYDNGDPIRNERGNFYISTSARFMGRNGGSGGICVYEMDANGRIVRPVSLIVARKDNWVEAGTAAKLVFDRKTEQWIYIARAFPSPGGKLHIGKSKENLLADGLHLITCNTSEGIVNNSLDGDLIKIDDLWYLAYHGGQPRKLHIANSTDLEKWEEIDAVSTGEGISIAKKNGEYFIVDATSSTKMNVRKMLSPSEIVGSIKLNPTPGNQRKNGGYPWGCIIPVENKDCTKYLMVCFSMDEYIENKSGGIFTYGDIFSYVAEE